MPTPTNTRSAIGASDPDARSSPARAAGGTWYCHGRLTACLHLALGVSGPVLGLVSGHVAFGAVFIVSAIAVLWVVPVAVRLNQGDRK